MTKGITMTLKIKKLASAIFLIFLLTSCGNGKMEKLNTNFNQPPTRLEVKEQFTPPIDMIKIKGQFSKTKFFLYAFLHFQILYILLLNTFLNHYLFLNRNHYCKSNT